MEPTPQTERPQKKSRWFSLKNRRHLPSWMMGLAKAMIKLLTWTYRIQIVDESGFYNDFKGWPGVIVLWHNRLSVVFVLKRCFVRRVSVLVSASRDGEYIADILRYLEMGIVRGSSSRGGAQALVELIRELKSERSVALTVDGPRGPRYTVHPGAAVLAIKKQIPIVPVSINASRYWQVKSWDETQIPKPFSRVTAVFGKPVMLPPDISVEEGSQRISQALMDITQD